LPISTAPYKRAYAHTRTRGKEGLVRCGYCGRLVPRYKTLIKYRGFRINDPTLLKQVPRYQMHMFSQKMYVCPSCARFRRVIQPGRSVRKKHLKI
jgi:small subunit ribosomal protein S26e